MKQELERRGLYSSKQSHAGDGLRFRYSGRDRLTSTIDREITPYVFYFDLFVGSNSQVFFSNQLIQVRTTKNSSATNPTSKS